MYLVYFSTGFWTIVPHTANRKGMCMHTYRQMHGNTHACARTHVHTHTHTHTVCKPITRLAAEVFVWSYFTFCLFGLQTGALFLVCLSLLACEDLPTRSNYF